MCIVYMQILYIHGHVGLRCIIGFDCMAKPRCTGCVCVNMTRKHTKQIWCQTMYP